VHDAKHYQFWSDGTEDGKFTITKVRPGTYTLHAFADGVLGEFAQANITIAAGQVIDLGKLEWKPVRFGRQLWEIGYSDRTGGKFFKGDGDNYWLWGWGLRYPLLFPNDITYTIGKSDYRKDWFFQQTPHGESTAWLNPAAKDPANQRFGWVKTESLDQYPQTKAHLRPRPRVHLDDQVQRGEGGAGRRRAAARSRGRRRSGVDRRGEQQGDRGRSSREHERPALQYEQGGVAGADAEVRCCAAESR
jgi:hypothetical protein